MATWNTPALPNLISVDIPALQQLLLSLTKMDPSAHEDVVAGAIRCVATTTGIYQFQAYDGSAWAKLPTLNMSVTHVNDYTTSTTATASTIAVRNADGKLAGDITGNAATATSAQALSVTNPIDKGGTGATTAAGARTNLAVPPISHASTASTYGMSTATNYGHNKLSDAVDSTLTAATGGTAASPAAVKSAYDKATTIMAGATSAANGASGIVPAPLIAQRESFLRGDGTWQEVPLPSNATTTTEGIMRFATDAEASDASEVNAAVKPHQVEIIAQNVSNAIPSDMPVLSTGVGIYRHSSGAGSVIVFGGKQVLVADASYRIGSKTWDAAVSWCAGKTIGGLRCYMPDLDTLRVIWLNRTSIDNFDPTASSNTTKKLSNWGFGSRNAWVWSRSPYYSGSSEGNAWILDSDGYADYVSVIGPYGALPCLEL